MCAWGPVFVRPPIAVEPKIETETVNEWHLWTFLPSACSCPRLHRPPFKAGPFEYWRDNPLPSITKQPWECVQCVRSLSVQVLVSHSLPFLPLKSVFLSYFGSLIYRTAYTRQTVSSLRLCAWAVLGAWIVFLQLMHRFFTLWVNHRCVTFQSKLGTNDEYSMWGNQRLFWRKKTRPINYFAAEVWMSTWCVRLTELTANRAGHRLSFQMNTNGFVSVAC